MLDGERYQGKGKGLGPARGGVEERYQGKGLGMGDSITIAPHLPISPSGPRRPTARGIRTGCFSGCPGPGLVCCLAVRVKVLAAERGGERVNEELKDDAI